MVAVIPFSRTDLQRSAELPAWLSVNAKHAPSQCLPTLPLPIVPPCFGSGHPAQPVDTLLTCDLSCSCSLTATSPMFLPSFRSHCLFLPPYSSLPSLPPQVLLSSLCLSLFSLCPLHPATGSSHMQLPGQRCTKGPHSEKKAH